jgi:DNA-binding MarR family transcriptional regulator
VRSGPGPTRPPAPAASLCRVCVTSWPVPLLDVRTLLFGRTPGVLDSQLRRDAGLTHFEYFVLAMLSEAPDRTLRMTGLAQRTNATLARLSHVVRRLGDRGLVERFPCPEDGRATNARLTDAGWAEVVAAAPGHVANVRRHVIDALTPEQISQLGEISDALLERLDPDQLMTRR